jgi:hypothetical protein
MKATADAQLWLLDRDVKHKDVEAVRFAVLVEPDARKPVSYVATPGAGYMDPDTRIRDVGTREHTDWNGRVVDVRRFEIGEGDERLGAIGGELPARSWRGEKQSRAGRV